MTMKMKDLLLSIKELDSTAVEKHFAQKEVEAETKANEVMHSTNSGYGAEFVPEATLAQEIYNLVPTQSSLLGALPNNLGFGLPKTYKQPINGLSNSDLLFTGKSEWTTGDKITSGDGTKQPTKVAQIDQASFIAKVDVSDELLRRGIPAVEAYLRARLAEGMAMTCEALIINADSETGSTGNVNSDDGAPTSGLYHLQSDHGIRELMINNGFGVSGGTLDESDFVSMFQKLNGYYTPEDCLMLMNQQTWLKMSGLSEVVTRDKMGDLATNLRGLVGAYKGVPVLGHRYVPNTEADGKVSTTPANNTKGQILAINKRGVHFGFGTDLLIEPVRVAGYGYQFVSTFEFGFDIVEAESGASNSTVAGIYNITL